jgi:hypothetical protein
MMYGHEHGHGPLAEPELVGDLIWQALRRGGAIARRRDGQLWKFATRLAEIKVDGSLLDPLHRGMILGQMATHPCARWADLWLPVPNGMNDDVMELGEMFDEQRVARVVRPNREKVYEFEFTDDDQITKVEAAGQAMLWEDVSTTGSTAFHLARMLRRINPGLQIHSLSWLQRSEVRPEYTQGDDGVVYHTLCRTDVPTEYSSFVEKFGFKPALV